MAFADPGSEEKVVSNPTTITEAPTLAEYKQITNTRDFGSERYYYPLELGGNEISFPGIIRFSAREIERVELSSFFGETFEAVSQATTGYMNWLEGNYEGTAESITEFLKVLGIELTEDEKKRINPPSDVSGENLEDKVAAASAAAEIVMEKIKEAGSKAIDDFLNGELDKRSIVIENLLSGGRIVGSVSLPLPQDIRISDIMNYSGASLGMIGGFAESGITSPVGATTNTLRAIGSATGAVFSETKQSKEISSLILSGIKQIPLLGGQLGDAASSAARISTNPNIRNLFDNVQLRNFTFTFKLVPTSEREAREIENIVKFFRVNMYPETVSVGDIPVGYIYPNVFDISMLFRNKNLPHKLLPCYLRSFNTAYNPTGYGMLRGGYFSETEISLDFQEVITLDRAKIALEGGY